MSGLNRLGLGHLPKSLIDPVECPPAPGQGALAIQTRTSDIGAAWLEALRHAPTAVAVAAERGALAALEGSCKTAIGAHARLANGELHLIVEALSPDGRYRFRREGAAELSAARDPEEAARDLGLSLGTAIAEEAGDLILSPD
jgi:hydroxymethylbilane synthase